MMMQQIKPPARMPASSMSIGLSLGSLVSDTAALMCMGKQQKMVPVLGYFINIYLVYRKGRVAERVGKTEKDLTSTSSFPK